ncbi:uncharacterized protein IL334_005852 [Kwoniella shivajii]|uniref:SDE2-like domain-containing protein n=1 Tax=Kwoniella shivajii TaxID=564305 RepID=A0ABZ1D7D3_9TREE|nr:hypothetical protein IL334_005852 [Kwoniella shivajii]
MLQTVHLNLPSPFPAKILRLPPTTPLSSLLPEWTTTETTYIRTNSSSRSLPLDASIESLRYDESPDYPITLHVCARLLGGKGGFGSQLRAAGGRMSSGKATNMDSCRDLSGRRLGTIKEAQRQADLLESAPALRAKLQAEEKSKLEALERKLGIAPIENDTDAEGSSSSSKRKIVEDVDLEALAAKKHKFEDNKFLEESREINDNVRSAVSKAMLLKKKKNIVTAKSTEDASKGKEKIEQVTKKEKEKMAMPPPALTNVA